MFRVSINYGSIMVAGLALVSAQPGSAEVPERWDCDTAELRQAADGGDAESQHDLGLCLSATPDDLRNAEARKWFNAAMKQGDLEAMNSYAVLLERGIGGPAEPERAHKLIEKAAKRGGSGAQLALADRYLNAEGKDPRNDAKGLELLMQAATGGRLKGVSLGETEWRIGMMYREGIGTGKDPEAAYQWVSRSAENGAINGMLSRAVMLATGEGVAEDDVAAREWYRKVIFSKHKGLVHGLRGLGAMLWYGEGGAMDHAQGCMMLNAAYRLGDKNAEIILEPIAAKLSNELKKSCNDDAQKWIDENLKPQQH